MVRWSLMGEYLSLLIIGIIFIRYYCYEGSVVFSLKKKIFLGCLLSAEPLPVKRTVKKYKISPASSL